MRWVSHVENGCGHKRNESKSPSCCEKFHWPRLDRNSLRIPDIQSSFEPTHFTDLCVAWCSFEKKRCEDSRLFWWPWRCKTRCVWQSLHKSCVTDCRSRENKCWNWTLLCSAPSKRTESLMETSCSWLGRNCHGFSTVWINIPSMFMNGTELVGLIGVQVVDLLVAGYDDDPIFSAALLKLKQIISLVERVMRTVSHWQSLKLRDFLTAAFICEQQKFVDQLELMYLEPTPFSSTHWQINAKWVNSASTSVWFCELVWKPRLVLISVWIRLLQDARHTVVVGDCGLGVRRYGSSQSGSLMDKRILDGLERTTLADWKSYKCQRVVRNSPCWWDSSSRLNA